MSRSDDHVIPYEEAVRRRRALEEAQKQKGVIHEVRISDAMSHLLEEAEAPEQEGEGPTPTHLREIVERDFAEDVQSGDASEEDKSRLQDVPSRRHSERSEEPPRH